jgi:hypothetical protein
MPPELNLKRAVFALGKIDEILAWDKERVNERDFRFVDLGRYLCEVRAGQYWRLERTKSLDDFPRKTIPRLATESLLPDGNPRKSDARPKQQLREIGWTKARELAKVTRREGQRFESAAWVHKAQELPKEEFKSLMLGSYKSRGYRDDLCGFPGWSQFAGRQSRHSGSGRSPPRRDAAN